MFGSLQRSLFLGVCVLLLLVSAADSAGVAGPRAAGNSRVRVYDSSGAQQFNSIITQGPGRAVGTSFGFVIVDDGERRVRIYNLSGALQYQPIATSGPVKIVPHGNLVAVSDSTGLQLYTLFGYPQGKRINTSGQADLLAMGNILLVVEDTRVRIFDLYGNQTGSSIPTNRWPGIAKGNTRFAVIDDGRVRIYDDLGILKRQVTTTGPGAVVVKENLFTVIDDLQVRIYNVFGLPVGNPILTNGRANVATPTDRIVVADNGSVRFFAEGNGALLNTVAAIGPARVVANILNVAIIDDGDQRLRIYDSTGNQEQTALNTGSPVGVVVTLHNRFVVVEPHKARILDPFGTIVQDNIGTDGRADVRTVLDRIILIDDSSVRLYDHFGNKLGPTFDTVARGDVVANVKSIAIHDDSRVRLYNHVYDQVGASIGTNGQVSLSSAVDRIIVVDEQFDVNHAPVVNNTGAPALTTLNEDAVDNDGMLVADLIASAGVDMITDVDVAAVEGLAVIAADNAHGAWQYSTSTNRANWRHLGTPSTGTARLLASDGHTRVRFVPAADFNGVLNTGIAFRAWDQTSGFNGGTANTSSNGGRTAFSRDTETASVTVNPVNDPPSFLKGPDQTVKAAAGPQTLAHWATQIKAGPPDELGQSLSFILTNDNNALFDAQPAVAPNGTLTFTPNDGASGSTTITVVLKDDGGTASGGVDQSPPQTFIVTVLPNDGSPVAVDDEATTPADTPVTIPVLDNDIEPDMDAMMVVSITAPAHGAATTDGTTATYTPTLGFNGIDGFAYTVSDSGSLTDTGSVTVFVGAVNGAPVLDNSGAPALLAIDEDETGNPGTLVFALISSVLPLDMITDPDASALEGVAIIGLDEGHGDWEFSTDNGGSWSSLGSPSSAAARLLAADDSTRVRFVPDADFNGTLGAGVAFRAWDQTSGANGGTADSTANGGLTAFSSAIETAGVTVNPVNDPPDARDDTANTPADISRVIAVLGNDSDVDGDLPTVVALGTPANGATALLLNGAVNYTPHPSFTGSDVFTYTVADSGSLTDTARVTVSVGVENNAPNAVADLAHADQGTAITIPVLVNDTDPDGDTLVVTDVSVPNNGTAASDGRGVTYTPVPAFTGSDSFSYMLSDGVLTDTARITVVVSGPSNRFWENDPFDGLALGELAGQNGWFRARPDRASPQVVAEGGGRVLKIDPLPGSGDTIIVGKDVSHQSGGRHTFSFRVKVTGSPDPAEPSLAKIEVRKPSSLGWDKKLQLYFGPSMRVNYGPQGQAAVFIPSALPNTWYRVRVEMDLANELLDLWVDGSLVLSDIPMHPGPITDLGISGWDRDGEVWLDDLLGFQNQGPGPKVSTCSASTFDAGDEGWRVSGDAQSGATLPDFFPTGGNPGGYISAIDDVAGQLWYWQAPAPFLGDRSASYNQTLSFDLKTTSITNPVLRQEVILTGGGLTVIYDLGTPPGSDWTAYSVPLHEAAGWKVEGSGIPPTQAEMQAVLGDLTKLLIQGEYNNGPDTGGLDNVVLEPSGCPALGSEVYWSNPSGSRWWTDVANWNIDEVPDAAHDVFMTLNGTYNATLDTSAMVNSLIIGAPIGRQTLWLMTFGEAAGDLTVKNGLLNRGTIGLGAAETSALSRLTVLSGTLTNYGAIDVAEADGGTYRIQGDVDNLGLVNVDYDLVYSGVFSNSGTVNVGASRRMLLSGSSRVFNQNGGAVTGAGELALQSGASFNFNSGSVFTTPVRLSSANLNLGSAANGLGRFFMTGAGNRLGGDIGTWTSLSITGDGAGDATATAQVGFTNYGSLSLGSAGGATDATLVVSSGTLTNAGTIQVDKGTGGDRTLVGNVVNGGVILVDLDSGQLIRAFGATFENADGGIVKGNGRFVFVGPTFTNSGVVMPGLSTGVLTMTGTFSQTATGGLAVEIGGLNPGSEYDRLVVSNGAALSGTLSISVTNGFKPVFGDRFEILKCGRCSGTFAVVEGTEIGDGLVFDVVYSLDGVELQVVEIPKLYHYLPLIQKP